MPTTDGDLEQRLTADVALERAPAGPARELTADEPRHRRNRKIILMFAGLVAVDLTALQFGDAFGTIVSIVGTVTLGVVLWIMHRRPAV